MKKLIALFAAFALCLAFPFTVGCGDKNNGEKDVLKVGMECAYQPYNWSQLDDSNGALPIANRPGMYANGYDVKIAKKIADSMGKKLEIYEYVWDGLIPAVQTGTLDMIIAGMSPTAERKLQIDFSDVYLTSNLVIVVKKDGAYADVTSIAELANTGIKVAAQSGTFHDDVIEQIEGVVHPDALKDFPALINALKTGAIDGYIAEESGAIADCNSVSEFKYIPLKNNTTGFTADDGDVSIAVGVKKGSSLLEGINAALANISEEERAQLMDEAVAQAPEA